MTARQILERALDRYESGRYRWTKFKIYDRHQEHGKTVESVCLVGSLMRSPGDSHASNQEPGAAKAQELLLQAILEVPSRHHRTVPDFNDASRTSKRMAIKALRRAVELATPKEELALRLELAEMRANEEDLAVSGD